MGRREINARATWDKRYIYLEMYAKHTACKLVKLADEQAVALRAYAKSCLGFLIS